MNHHSRSSPLVIRLLVAGGAIGPILFILVFLIEGATRPGYSAWHKFVSDLRVGNQGWVQIANFFFYGTLMLGFALGPRQVFHSGKGVVWGPLLLSAFGQSLIIAGWGWTALLAIQLLRQMRSSITLASLTER